MYPRVSMHVYILLRNATLTISTQREHNTLFNVWALPSCDGVLCSCFRSIVQQSVSIYFSSNIRQELEDKQYKASNLQPESLCVK
jgi:hypothetical protein